MDMFIRLVESQEDTPPALGRFKTLFGGDVVLELTATPEPSVGASQERAAANMKPEVSAPEAAGAHHAAPSTRAPQGRRAGAHAAL